MGQSIVCFCFLSERGGKERAGVHVGSGGEKSAGLVGIGDVGAVISRGAVDL